MKHPAYTLRVPDEAAELIRKMHPHLKKKIKASLKTILSDPESRKALKGELSGLRSFRMRRFRIIYRIFQKKNIEIVVIGPRECVYEETFCILGKTKKSD